MAVAFDAASESHAGTTGSASQASFTWNHAGGASARGALVFVFGVVTNALPPVTSVTYGGTTMTELPYSAIDTDTEPGSVKAFYLDNCGTGTKAVVVNRTNNTHVMYAVCYTVTAAKGTEVYTAGIKTRAGSAAEQTAASSSSTGTCTNFGLMSIDDGSPGTNSLRFMARYQGTSNVTAAGTGSTAPASGAASIDFGLYVCETFYETTAGQGARNVGGANVSDDLAVIALAVREINRNASVTATGGGVATEVGTKGAVLPAAGTGGGVAVLAPKGAHAPAITSTGGGVAALAPKGAHVNDVTATGGGVLAPAPVAGRIHAVVATAGGVVVVTGVAAVIDNRNASVTATGGGVSAVATRKGASSAPADTGGGVAVVTVGTQRTRAVAGTASGVATMAQATERNVSPAAAGGGVATLTRVAGRSASPTTTGGGVATLSQRSARVLAAQLSGGGVLTYAEGTGRRTSVAATGGGVSIVTGVAAIATEDKVASIAATGGGAAVVEGSTRRAVAAVATAGGQVSLSIQSARQLAIAMTGAGAVVLDGLSGRLADVDATGGGAALVDGTGAAAPGLIALMRIANGSAGRAPIAAAPPASVLSVSDAPVITSARFIP